MQYLKTEIIGRNFRGEFSVGFFAGPRSHLFHCLRKDYFKLKYNLLKLGSVRVLLRISNQQLIKVIEVRNNNLFIRNGKSSFSEIMGNKNFGNHCLGFTNQAEF